MNRLILESINVDNFIKVDLESNIILDSKTSLIDCQILNLIKYFPNLFIPSEVNILDYSSLGQRSLIFSDFKFPIEFARAILRNIRFKKKFSPSSIWHWDDYAKNSRQNFVNFGWLNKFIETGLILELSKQFLEHNKPLFPEIAHLNLNAKTLIVSPHVFANTKDISLELNYLISKNSKIEKWFWEAEFIIIKQHRASELELPDYLQVRGKSITVLKCPFSRVLPMEILTFGLSNSYLISTPSSVLYSNNELKCVEIPTNDLDSKKAYGLNIRRKAKINK